MVGKDPVKVTREALAKTLVFYYTFAGRLKEGEGCKLVVECNEEGVMFIEAEADVALQQFDDDLQPPFPCLEDLLYSPLSSDEILHSPIFLIQVTRLKCGGFIFGVRVNHTMSDAFGIVQFMKAIPEIANGATEPSIQPVWHRELLNARDPPHVTCTHYEYDDEVMDRTIDIPTMDILFVALSSLDQVRFLPSVDYSPTTYANLPHHLSLSQHAFGVVEQKLYN